MADRYVWGVDHGSSILPIPTKFYGAFDYRLGRKVFNLKGGVQFPYALPKFGAASLIPIGLGE